MCRNLIFLNFSLLTFNLFSQQNKDTLRLFYGINETQSKINFVKLDSLVKKLNAKNIQLKILGYADYLHSDSYNQVLSQKRADAIKSYLLKNHYSKVTILQSKGMGEKFSKALESKEGEAFQRRVDIVLDRVTPLNEVDTRPIQIGKPIEELEKVDLHELGKGQSLILEGLSFIPGKHTIMKESKPVLEKLLKTLKDNPTLKIEIQGHICCPDGKEDALDYDTYDRKLSHNRARAIYEYLINNGIGRERLQYKGYGHSKPRVDPETTPEEEQMNRRVEVMVIEN